MRLGKKHYFKLMYFKGQKTSSGGLSKDGVQIGLLCLK